MIAVIAALAIQAQPGAADNPADWQCAQPFIEKNYTQKVEARELALRIADECARPYTPRRSAGDPDGSMARTIYNYSLTSFRLEIESRIMALRRREAIDLK